ncbi:DNA recombination protein RmuC [Kordiimonas marina]|uniref:DNA recombination protein RmuC n=1 Tax=Kordiimonas marina TaxID=2872312 RepID=UPI001FF30B6C|nr:DNA recombination protein RmuC [Kordiimonas marina]MCJ9429413.1 DNA recombination protein RmuC [Kordiimonas marina]
MSQFELITVGAVGLLLLLVLWLVAQVRKLSANLEGGDDQSQLIRIETRLHDMADAAARREQATRTELGQQFRDNREEVSKAIAALAEQMRKLGMAQAEDQTKFRDKLDEKMKELREENSRKLDEMRKTVDEKLQTTLEKRLSESFKAVSERLEAVQRGLGEMQSLATGVGDLKRVLTNVKSRGTFGEVQLGLLIEDFLTQDQYVANYDCGKSSGGERVEFGIRVPGTERDVFLPVDAKFPTEDYERLLGAVEIGDKVGIEDAGKGLERSVRKFAKDINTKYINPPHTTDWAILFLPTEGLYAEVLRRPGLFESLQRDLKVTVAGPTNFQVLLSTFRMGFRQMALEERAGEVWDVLGAVKREFEKFGGDVDKIAKQLHTALHQTDEIQKRKRVMLKALKNVEAVEAENAAPMLFGDEDA